MLRQEVNRKAMELSPAQLSLATRTKMRLLAGSPVLILIVTLAFGRDRIA
jgi:hypothetical protein